MPTGVYKRLEVIPGTFEKGQIPHNKGIQDEKVKKKVDRVKLGLPIVCEKHGEHNKWRLHSHNNVQCKICGAEWARNRRDKNPIKYLLVDAKAHAKKKGLDFCLEEKDIFDLLLKQGNKCALSELPFDSEDGTYKPSIDRIDPKIGYIVENIQLVIFEINRMKSDLSQKRFLNLCARVADVRRKMYE